MQAVILAAGNGERLRPLTDSRPKPLVSIAGRPMLEHILDQLPQTIDEIILVVGYCGHMIKKHLGSKWRDKKIRYVIQEKPLGTFNALYVAKPLLRHYFLVLAGDVYCSQTDLNKLVSNAPSILVRREQVTPEKPIGFCQVDNGLLTKVEEKAQKSGLVFINCAAFCITPKIFSQPVILGHNDEQWLSSMIGTLAATEPIKAITATAHWTVTVPDDIKKVEQKHFPHINSCS